MIANASEYLLIEDNRFDVEISLFDFEEHGIANKFHIERDGAEALDYLFAEDGSLRVEPPKVIFLDLHMPKISGLDFLRRIKANEQTKRIPIIVLKSSISPVEVNECQCLGVNDYIEKPLEYKNFINPEFPELYNEARCNTAN
jgi:two-component system, response regulator